ncbi:MAG: hypothetical protein PHX18_09070 [Candidatus Gastranaerophilales bacterium]|nr:hypothetical protein [Candidatus Gastranaerophilales bacterium]
MRLKIVGLICAALFATAGAALAAVPPLRYGVSALINSPVQMPAVGAEPRVHFQPGAEACAAEVAALLPKTVTAIEAQQLRKFVSGPIVGVYATDDAYALANGVGSAGPAGVTFTGRLTLAPRLCGADHARLSAVLTHELSHVNLQQNLSWFAYVHLPNWFKEGLAVSVSEGGGAEKVTPQEARAEMSTGPRIAIVDSGALLNLTAVPFEKPIEKFDIRLAYLAYRQAGMFVDFLRADQPAFDELLQGLYAGEDFASAFRTAYRTMPASKWAQFVSNSR